MSGLVSLAWLHQRLSDPAVRIIDLRLAIEGGRSAYHEAHVPGAVFSDYIADGWRQKVGDVPGLLPEAEQRAALFGALGITADHHVVLVPEGASANDFAASARAYWTLRTSGHDAVSILDGGTKGWIAAGLPVEAGEGPNPATVAYPVKPVAHLRCHAKDVLMSLEHGRATLVDARSASFFNGVDKAIEAKAAGHIPGAVSLDYASAFDVSTGRLRPKSELAALCARIRDGVPVISYCNTGHSAALNWFVLSEILGLADVRLYDGSMTDWTQDETRPVHQNL